MKRKNRAAVAMAKLRAKKLSPTRRREIATKAATERWARVRLAKEVFGHAR